MPVTEQDLIEIRNSLHKLRSRITDLENQTVQLDSMAGELHDEFANLKLDVVRLENA